MEAMGKRRGLLAKFSASHEPAPARFACALLAACDCLALFFYMLFPDLWPSSLLPPPEGLILWAWVLASSSWLGLALLAIWKPPRVARVVMVGSRARVDNLLVLLAYALVGVIHFGESSRLIEIVLTDGQGLPRPYLIEARALIPRPSLPSVIRFLLLDMNDVHILKRALRLADMCVVVIGPDDVEDSRSVERALESARAFRKTLCVLDGVRVTSVHWVKAAEYVEDDLKRAIEQYFDGSIMASSAVQAILARLEKLAPYGR